MVDKVTGIPGWSEGIVDLLDTICLLKQNLF
jgi:hypothetical protein